MMRGSIRILLIGLFCFGCFACKDDKDEVTPIEEEEVYLDVNPISLSFESDGGEKEVSINSNGSWNIDFTGISWVRPNISVSKGNAIVKFTADKNNSTTNRSAAITVSAQGAQPVRLQLTQAPAEGGLPSGEDIFSYEPYIQVDNTGMRDLSSLELSELMGVGWNLGNSLEAVIVNNGVYSGGETSWGNPATTKEFITTVREAGFNTIRVPVSWSHKLADKENMLISLQWLKRVEEIVNFALDNDMFVIINIHWDGGWLNHPTYDKQDEINTRLAKYWEQIAAYFRDYDDHLLFAGTNEVMMENDYGTPTAEYLAVQNSFNQTFVSTVRGTGGRNAYRHLVVQGFNTNISHTVNGFVMPADDKEDRLFAEVHYYDPWEYTLKEDAPYNTQWGSIAEGGDVGSWGQEEWLEEQMALMKTNFVDKGIPVILGEYSPLHRKDLPSDKYELHQASRVYYIEYLTREAIKNGLVPIYWDNGYAGNNGSAIFDRNNGKIVDQGALDAIMKAKGEN